MGSEILGAENPRSGRDAHEQNQQQVQDRPCRSHRRQRRIPDILAHDDGVHRIVQLLGKIADQQRNRKAGQNHQRPADRHVLCAEEGLDAAHVQAPRCERSSCFLSISVFRSPRKIVHPGANASGMAAFLSPALSCPGCFLIPFFSPQHCAGHSAEGQLRSG